MLSLDQICERLALVTSLPDFTGRAEVTSPLLEQAAAMESTPEDWACQFLNSAMIAPVPKSYPVKNVNWIPGHHVGQAHCPGPRDEAKVMVVGKSPYSGSHDLLSSQASDDSFFVYKRLQDAGFTPELFKQTYITSACRFVPTKKQVAAVWLKASNWLLWAEIFFVKPKFLLLMGAEAVKSVLGNKASVERLRGDFKDLVINYGTEENPDPHVIKLFAMTNPNAALRDPAKTPEIELDLKVFASRVAGTTKTATNPVEYHLVENTEQLNALEEIIKDKTEFAIDCEWSGQSPYHHEAHLLTIQLSWDIGKAATIVVAPQDDGGPDNSCDNIAVRDMLNRVLCRNDADGLPAVSVIGHNFRSDFPWLKKFGVDLTEQLHQGFDTMLAHHLLRETGGQGLEVCVLEYTDLGRYDIPLAEWVNANLSEDAVEQTGYEKVPREILYPYAFLDADASFRVYLGLKEELKKYPRLYDLFYNVVMKANIAITEMEENGIYVDQERLEELAELYDAKREQLLIKLRHMIDWPDFNYRSVNQARELLFGVSLNGKRDPQNPSKNIRLSPPTALLLNLTPVKTTDKPTKMWFKVVAEGKEKEASPSTDSETLGMLADKHPVCTLFRDLKFVDQICKNFIPSLKAREKKIRGLPNT